MGVQYGEYTFPSTSGEGQIFGRCWRPKEIRGIVVIAHGMSEHSGRYDRVGRLLAENGYAVYANDHLGHGKSAHDHIGTFVLKGRGFFYVMNDLRRVLRLAGKKNPGVPRVLMGHSMGSILSGLIADRYGAELDGLVLLGTPSPNPLSGVFSLACRSIAAVMGATYESEIINWLLNSATSGNGDDALGERQWLSNNTESNLAFMNDPLCGENFSCSANAESAAGLWKFGSRHWGEGVPKDLPVLIMAGDADTAGDCGKAPRHYAERLKASGVRHVTMHLVEGGRHEVFNESDTSQSDAILLNWMDDVCRSFKGGAHYE